MLESTQQPVWGSRARLLSGCGPHRDLPPSPRELLVTAHCGRSRYRRAGGFLACRSGLPIVVGHAAHVHDALEDEFLLSEAGSERAQRASFNEQSFET